MAAVCGSQCGVHQPCAHGMVCSKPTLVLVDQVASGSLPCEIPVPVTCYDTLPVGATIIKATLSTCDLTKDPKPLN